MNVPLWPPADNHPVRIIALAVIFYLIHRPCKIIFFIRPYEINLCSRLESRTNIEHQGLLFLEKCWFMAVICFISMLEHDNYHRPNAPIITKF